MGSIHSPTCRSCGHHWENELIGGLMMAGQYRCETCGMDVMVDAEGLQSAGLPAETSLWDLTAEQVRDAVGACGCGGAFSADAPARCPRCRGTDVDLGVPFIMVD